MSTEWVALGGGLACHVRDGRVEGTAKADRDADALTQLGLPEPRIIRVGEGAPTTLPTSVLPDGGKTVPALIQEAPPDVISGWVRLWIAGYTATRPHWDGVICALHGDVAHWVHVSAGEAVSSQSSLTPRLWSALGGGEALDERAVADSLSRPEHLATQLRAAEITGKGAALTGHLIGADLAAARRYWLGQELVVIGDSPLAPLYASAFEAQGMEVRHHMVGEVLPNGLIALGVALGLDQAVPS